MPNLANSSLGAAITADTTPVTSSWNIKYTDPNNLITNLTNRSNRSRNGPREYDSVGDNVSQTSSYYSCYVTNYD